MTDWERAICARVKQVRESIQWSQAAFAHQLGISRDQLASIEYGRTPLRYDIAWRLRENFGISLGWLEEGFGFPNSPEHDEFPPPHKTELSPRALLSVVAQHCPTESATRASQQFHGLVDASGQPQLPEAVLRILEGEEKETGESDIPHRLVHSNILKLSLDGWISEVPLGHLHQFSNHMVKAASDFISSLPADSAKAIDARNDALIWERLREASARRALEASCMKKKLLPYITASANISAVKSPMAHLLRRLNNATSQRGMKSKLAKAMGVSLANVSQWLSGEREPGGETTLRLLHWVEQQERQQNTLDSDTNTAKGKTQVHKSKTNEKANSNPQKR